MCGCCLNQIDDAGGGVLITLRCNLAPFGLLLGVFVEYERDPFAHVVRHRLALPMAQFFESIQLLVVQVAGDQDAF